MDAEGRHEGVPCPRCGSEGTITYHYAEGFEELECPACGYASDAAELDSLTRYDSALLEGVGPSATPAASRGRLPAQGPDLPPIPRRTLKA